MFIKRINFKEKWIYVFLFCLILIGIYLRFVNFEKFVTFLGDQGRDAIIFKRIVTLEHPTLVGPPSSIGGVYLGPFFYYFIAPWLLIFNFDPVGPAFGVGLFSCLYLVINYYIINKMIDQKTALISTILTTFSLTLINFSRFSWNPNLLPLFSLVTVYCAYQAYKTNRSVFFILTGLMLSLTVQLHYLALLILPPVVLYFYVLNKNEKKPPISRKKITLSIVAMIIFSSPLIFFDLRHRFLNTVNLLSLFKQTDNFSQNKLVSFLNTFNKLIQFTFNQEFNLIFSTIIFALIIFIYFKFLLKKRGNIHLFFIITLFYIVGISFYKELKSAHYYGAIYPFFFALLSYLLSLLQGRKFLLSIGIIFIFIYTNSRSYYFLANTTTSQIDKAKKVAQVISDNNDISKYSLVSLPESSSEAQYRYFLEIWGHKPIDREVYERTNQLFITCEQPCLTIGNPQWDVALFAPTKTIGTWKVENVTIYKLTH